MVLKNWKVEFLKGGVAAGILYPEVVIHDIDISWSVMELLLSELRGSIAVVLNAVGFEAAPEVTPDVFSMEASDPAVSGVAENARVACASGVAKLDIAMACT